MQCETLWFGVMAGQLSANKPLEKPSAPWNQGLQVRGSKGKKVFFFVNFALSAVVTEENRKKNGSEKTAAL